MSMRVVIVGAGSTGRALADRISSRHEVVLVDPDVEALDGDDSNSESTEDKKATSDQGVTVVRGDGTSRIQLQRAFTDDGPCALVAAGGSDEVNLETVRLGKKLGYEPVLALQHDRVSADKYFALGVTVLDRAQLLADHLELSLEHQGAVVPTGIGLGRGELVEIRLMGTSPVLDRPLKDMAPESWRIAAVFRDDQLIVPTGDITLQIDDRVLLVGDPGVLRSVAEYIRLGTPQFPRQFGPNVVSVERDSSDTKHRGEPKWLASSCSPSVWARGVPGQGPAEPDVTDTGNDDLAPGEQTTTFGYGSFEDGGFIGQIQREHPGVVVTRPFKRSKLARFTGRRGADAWLCDGLNAPVLFNRGTFPYRRILLPVSASRLSVDAAELAIDLTRRLSGELTAVNVDLPRYISGETEEMIHFEVVPVKRLCQLYEVPLEYRHHVGNPVRLLLQEARHHDLIVMARRRRRKDTYFTPDVALRIAREATCSVLILTIGPTR